MTLRVGMIGAGWVTGRHLDAWLAHADRAKVVAIADPSEAARIARAARYAIPRAYADAAEMLANVPLDAVDIASPREFHAEHVRLAAARGLPVLCQKPLATTFAAAEVLVADVRVPLMVHENWRFRPHYRLIRHWLDEARVGKPVQVSMNLLTSGLIPDAEGRPPALLRQPMLTGLDQMLVKEILIHHIDTLRFLFGELALTSASIGRLSNAVAGDDHALLCMASSDNTPVILTGNLHARGYPPEALDRLEIFGEAGRILLERDTLLLDGSPPETRFVDLAADYAGSYRDAIGCFIDGLARGSFAENSAVDNLGTLRIVDAAYERAGWRNASPKLAQ